MITEPLYFLGMKVFVDRGRPRYVLPENAPVTEAFRKEFNEWAAGFFEQRIYIVPADEVYVGENHSMYMREPMFVRLRNIL